MCPEQGQGDIQDEGARARFWIDFDDGAILGAGAAAAGRIPGHCIEVVESRRADEGVVTRGLVDPDDIAFLGHGKNRRLQRDRAKGQHQAQKQKGGNRVTCDGDYPLVFPGRGLKSPEIAMHDGLRCR